MIDNNEIIKILREIKHPNTGVDIISSKMVSDFKIQGEQVVFTITLKPQEDNLKPFLNASCTEEITSKFKEAKVLINFTKEVKNDVSTPLPQVKNIIAVASGKGGVGKSTVSLNLALSLRDQGYKVGLMDADLYGPSMPTMMGLQDQKPKVQTIEGKPKLMPIFKHGIHSISLGYLLEPEQAVVLRGPRLGGIIKQFVFDCVWPALDFLIIDLPPGTGDIQLTMVQTLPITGAVIVTTPQEVAVADAIKALNMFLLPNVKVPILGVVENMSWFSPVELPDNKYFIFGKGGGKKLAEFGNTNLLGTIPLIQGIREGGDQGTPIMSQDSNDTKRYFEECAVSFLGAIEKRNADISKTKIVRVN